MRVGARLGGYPLRDEDAERMLTQDYGLQLSFGSEPRWTVSGIYGLIGGLADDAYSSSRLDLTVEAAWE